MSWKGCGGGSLKIWQFQFNFVFFLGDTPHFFSLSTEREIYFELWEENILVVCWCWNRREFWSTENGTRRTNEWPRTWPCDHVTMTVWPWPWQVDVTPWTGMWPVTNALLLSKTMILHRYNVKYRTVTSTNQWQDERIENNCWPQRSICLRSRVNSCIHSTRISSLESKWFLFQCMICVVTSEFYRKV